MSELQITESKSNNTVSFLFKWLCFPCCSYLPYKTRGTDWTIVLVTHLLFKHLQVFVGLDMYKCAYIDIYSRDIYTAQFWCITADKTRFMYVFIYLFKNKGIHLPLSSFNCLSTDLSFFPPFCLQLFKNKKPNNFLLTMSGFLSLKIQYFLQYPVCIQPLHTSYWYLVIIRFARTLLTVLIEIILKV